MENLLLLNDIKKGRITLKKKYMVIENNECPGHKRARIPVMLVVGCMFYFNELVVLSKDYP